MYGCRTAFCLLMGAMGILGCISLLVYSMANGLSPMPDGDLKFMADIASLMLLFSEAKTPA